MDNITKVRDRILEKPYILDMGKNKIAKWLKVSPEEVKDAKKLARRELQLGRNNDHKLPKILIVDVETAPLKGYIWSRWKQNIYLDQTISEWFMLTWSAKWLFGKETFSNGLTPEEVKAENDGRIIKELWKLLDEADMVVAHNGDKFDIPKINSRFLLNNLPPTSPYKTIDTKKIAAKQFGFSSNKLDALAIYFGFETKMDTDFKLWADCMDGYPEALAYMEKYNRYDVELLENVYLRLRPWIKAHPNVGLYIESDEPVCSNCGSRHLTNDSYYYTSTGKYRVYRCECGALSRVRTTEYPKDKRKALLVSTAM